MPKWTYSITIINNTDRTLKLLSSNIPWGYKEKAFPSSIAPNEDGEFRVCSPSGAPYGIEFYFSMRDVANKGQHSYGTFTFSVDMPYLKHENQSSFTCTGILSQSGFQKVPDGAHDFSTTVTIFTSLQSASLAPEGLMADMGSFVPEYNGLYDWDSVEKLKTVQPGDVSINDFLPGKNVFHKRIPVGRTENMSLPKKLWGQVIDLKYPDDYSKQYFVKEYFTVSAYELRKNTTVNIAANQSYEKTLEISNRSTVRRETRKEFQIENTIAGGYSGEKFNLSDTLRMQYQISSLEEYCEESMASVREVFSYNATDTDRSVVLWDLAEILVLYRININGQVELVGVGDYYMESSQKTYLRNNSLQAAAPWLGNRQEVPGEGSENIILPEETDIEEYGAPRHASSPVTGSITINNVNYRWMEIKQGTNRGMLFNPGQHRYIFSPNPHRDPDYNSKQTQWYIKMAKEFQRVGNAGSFSADSWPAGAINNLTVNGITYTAR